jgi:hypothetical protein
MRCIIKLTEKLPEMSEGNGKISSMLGKRNEARRKAESQALFHTMLKTKHKVITPAPKKGTRSENKRNAIKESL